MLRLILDCETNGLVHELDRVHSLVLRDADDGHVYSGADQTGFEPISNVLSVVEQADLLIGHNIINLKDLCNKHCTPLSSKNIF